MPYRKTTAPSRLALLLGVSAAAFAARSPAFAQDATWLGVTGDFGTASNWIGGVVPSGTATFGATGATAVTTVNQTLGGFTFAAGASAYTFGMGGSLGFIGAGIVNNSGQIPTLNNSGTLAFLNSSTAGNATIPNNGGLEFYNASTAGNATISNNSFWDFYDTSTAGSAAITNNGVLVFNDASTAGNAAITNNFDGGLTFDHSSTAGNATITNYGDLGFYDKSTAGNARLITTAAGITAFLGTGPLGDGQVSAGSIEGDGAYHLGSVHLTVGGDGLSTEVSGVISGVGGALTKTGAGVLTLSGANSYSGGTTITAGSIIAGNDSAFGAGLVTLNGGTLATTGTRGIANNVSLASSSAISVLDATATLSGVISGSGGLTKTGTGALTLSGANTYTGGTTINSGRLSISADNHLGTTAGAVTFNGGTLATTASFTTTRNVTMNATATIDVAAATTLTANGNFTGAGAIAKNGTGALTLGGNNAGVTNGFLLNQGTLSLATTAAASFQRVGATGASVLDLANGVTMSANTLLSGSGLQYQVAAGTAMISGNISDPGGPFTYAKIGAGTLILTGTGNTVAGPLTLSGGTLQIGNGGTNGSLGTGNILNNAALVFNSSSLAYAGAITGIGTIAQNGGGRTTLSGNSSAFAGATTVAAGELRVDGSLGGTLTVNGGTLSGIGTIGGAVTVNAGGTLSAGNSPGTLTVGSLALSAGSNTVFELGTAGVAGGLTNDRIVVNGIGAAGNLALGGTLAATAASAGYYRLFDVTGGGTISGGFSALALTAPTVPGATGTVYSMPAGVPPQVNLAVIGAGQTLQFWDGADQAGNGTVNGGTGTWNGGNTNWAVAPGEVGFNAPWLNSVGVFQGTAGTVTVSGTQSFDTLQFNSDGYILNGGVLGLGVAAGGTINTASGVITTIGSAIIDGAGTSLTKVGPGTLILTGANTYSGGTTIGGGTLQAGSASALGSGPLTLAGGTFQAGTGFTNTFASAIAVDTSGGAIDVNGQVVTLTGNITDGNGAGGVLSLLNSSADIGRVDLSGSNSYSGPTAVGGGVTLAAAANGAFSPNSEVMLAPNAALMADGHAVTVRSLAGSGLVVNGHDTQAGSLTLALSSGTASFAGSIADDGPGETGATLALTKTGAGTQILAGANSYTGGTTILGGTLQIGAGGTSGSITGDVANGGALVFNRSDAFSFGGAVSGSGTLRQAGTGRTTLTGISSYTGATFVDAGTLVVNGSIAASSGVTVAAGAAVGGTGTLPSLTVNGTLAPGNSPGTLTVNGNLVMGARSTYIAEVQGPLADRVNVTGTASLAGTLRLVPLGGAYSFNSAYTLLSAAGGLGGTSFSPVDTTGTFGDGITTAVSYTGNDVLLTLTPKPLAPIIDPGVPQPLPEPTPPPTSPRLGVGRPANALAVASAIDGAVASGADPSALFGIYNLPAASIPAAVNSLSGEVHTAAPAMAHAASDQFLRMMLDGAGAGRLSGAPGGPGGATGFTADLPSRQDGPGRPSFDPARFSLWGATFGSTGRNDGDRAVGSANRNLSDGHVAVGADIRLGANTVAGVALAGGQSRASLSGGLGKAQADVFQAGLYGRTTLGTVNLAGALGYARLDTDTARAIPALGRSGVAASYATQALSGRIEASLPVAGWGSLTLSPLAAFQAVRASSPAAIERDGSGAATGMLTLARRSDMTSRSELGLQLDANLIAGATPVTGFVRAAWAHYYQRDAQLAASLTGLPGASFAVTGARPDRNAALLAAGADIRLSQTVSLGMRVDSELSGNTSRIGGTAQLRVSF